jgi:hypothetical protein
LEEATPPVYQGVFYRGYNNGLKTVVDKLEEAMPPVYQGVFNWEYNRGEVPCLSLLSKTQHKKI